MNNQVPANLINTQEIQRNEMKIIAMVSHDFRNPLAVAQLAVQSLRRYGHRMDEAEKAQRYDRILSQITRMNMLLENILLLGRSENNTRIFNPAPLDLGSFCQSIIEEFHILSDDTYQLTFMKSGDCSAAQVDKELVRSMLDNLLSNAIKYSPKGGEVSLSLDCTDKEIILQVSDQGIGIPEGDKPKLFETFYRAKNVDAIHGTGLGLAIIKHAVDIHGGTVTFESQTGVGTTFTILLPLHKDTGARS